MNPDKTFLGTQPVGKLLLKLAIPSVIAQIVNMLYNIVDRIYIGHIPETGSLALTGLGVCMPLILIVSAFAAFVSSGGAPRASIAMGKGDHETAQRILGGCFTMHILISAVLTAVLLIWGRDLLLLFGASENTIDFAASYMNIYAIGTVFVQLTLGLNAFITAQGFATFNMGVKGAALATILSQGISCVWVICFLMGKKTILKLRKGCLSPSPKLLLPCIALGLATFIMQASESIITVCFNSSLLKYGGDIAVGAMTILYSVMQFALLPMQGVSLGAQPILSYNYGAGNVARVKKTFRLLLTVSLSYTILLWAFIQLFPGVFARMFSSDAALIAFTAKALRVYCAALFIFGVQTACQMAFVSIGYAGCSIFVAVLRKFILLLPLIYLVPIFTPDKTMGVYLAEPIADAIAVSSTAVIFFFQFRKAMKKLEAAKK